MSLGERKRNSLFEETAKTEENNLDSRFIIESQTKQPPSQTTQPKVEESPDPNQETGWKPNRKTEKKPEARTEPQTVPPEIYEETELQQIQETVPQEDWNTPPVYGIGTILEQKEEVIVENDVDFLYEQQESPKEVLDFLHTEVKEPLPELGNRTHDIFHQATETQDFRAVLKQVQEYISTNYSQLITENAEDSKVQMKRFISKYILDQKVAVEGRNSVQLLEDLYVEMAEYGFLTKYVFGTGIEEIDINAWNDIEIQYSGGKTEKLKEHFDSPEHAINVIRRMLQVAGIVLDSSQPVVLGHLSKNIRIAVMKTPIVDEDVGVSASIRIVNPQSLEKEDFVQGGTATEKMLDFLSTCVRYGVSICVAGATSSGKTTVLGWLLGTIPHFKRVYTIESGSRELDLVKVDENGNVVNSVIHTLTRDSDNDKQKVDQIALLDVALRFNPDIVVVGEMRGPEANAAQEATRTGVAVLTTIHANSARATYARMISLCKRAVDMGDETLYQYVTEAYSIVVFCKQLENGSRKMMEIMECTIEKDGTRVYRTLFQYIITENHLENGVFVIEGHHKQVNPISQQMAKRFLENGMPVNEIKQWTEVNS